MVVAMITLFTGCAQPPKQKSYHAAEYKQEFASRIDLAVNYHLGEDSGIVVVDMFNPRRYNLRLWLVQDSQTDGQRITAAKRFYMGEKKKHQEVFRLPLPEEGLTERFWVEVFDNTGALTMKSEPIYSMPQEEGMK
jgi:hypothetical protein